MGIIDDSQKGAAEERNWLSSRIKRRCFRISKEMRR